MKGVQHAQGVSEVLRKNVVQGKKVEGKDAIRMACEQKA